MKTHLLKNMLVVGSTALALAASTVVLPSVADAAGAAGVRPHAQGYSGGRMHAGYYGRGGRGGYGGYGGYGGAGYYGGYYPGFCGPIQLTLGLCGPWGY